MNDVNEPWRLGLTEVVRAIRERRVSAVDVVGSSIERANRLSELRAWEAMDEYRALAAAAEVDMRIASGTPTGAIAGAPLGVKDVIFTQGLRTSAGSPLLAQFVPSEDAYCVAAVRRADGIVVGKTVTTEFAYGDPVATINPWDRTRTAGGSSTGSAVAVAAGIVPLALGTQTSGSTLRPAAYTGIVGFKPTYGLIPVSGILPLAWSFDHVGILVRSVDDAALALAAMMPAAAVAPIDQLKRPRVGVLTGPFIEKCDEETSRHVLEVVGRLSAHDWPIKEVDIAACYSELLTTFRIIVAADAAASHEARFAQSASAYGARIAALVTRGLRMSAVEYARAAHTVRTIVRRVEEIFADVDVLVCASTPTPAPRDLTSTGDPDNLVLASACGLPAISLPSGLAQEGVPLAIQLVGRRGGDGELLAIARKVEQILGFHAHPPVWEGDIHDVT